MVQARVTPEDEEYDECDQLFHDHEDNASGALWWMMTASEREVELAFNE